MPCKESDETDSPIQFYAATKKSNEVGGGYSHLYNINTFIQIFHSLRTRRPDMALLNLKIF